jgi:transcription antitermination factor NusG
MEVKKNWYAIYTKARCEKKVNGILLEKGLESYCPLNRVERKWSDRLKTVEEPLFKSYVFVHIGEEEKPKVRMTQGVVNFVYWQGKPAIIQDREIEVIRKFLHEYRDVIAEPLDLRPETRVSIRQGIFMDKVAKIKKIQGNRVQVIIESIGYSLVALIERSNLSMI